MSIEREAIMMLIATGDDGVWVKFIFPDKRERVVGPFAEMETATLFVREVAQRICEMAGPELDPEFVEIDPNVMVH